MKIDLSRLNKQQECIEAWRNNYGKGTIEACTRFGKTYMAVLCIKSIIAKKGACSVIIGVPGIVNKLDWEGTLEKHEIEAEVYVYNSLQGCDFVCDLFIADEIHVLGAEENNKILERGKYKWILGLTGTFERPDGNHVETARYAPVLMRITREEALANGWISNFEIHTFSVKMKNREQYDRICQQMKTITAFTGDFFECQNIIKNSNRYPKSTVSKAYDVIRLVQERKELVYSDPSKMEKAFEILKMYPQQAIVFFERIEHARVFGDMLEGVCTYEIYKGSEKTGEIHKTGKQAGKPKRKMTPKSENREIIDRFKRGETKVLLAAKALNMGVELNVTLAIMIAGNSSWVDFEQRLGRILTLKEGQICRMFQIICSGTIETGWSRTRSKNAKDIKHFLT